MTYFVYILASRPRGAIYIGKTTDLRHRLEQHRRGEAVSHVKKYDIFTLVYFEAHETPELAFAREAKLKRWRRAWKDDLIESINPGWKDLTADIPL